MGDKVNSSGSMHLYDEKYFLEDVDGFREYSKFEGKFSNLFERYQKNINLLELNSGHNYLEFGCGRGEICIYHALQGGRATGVDYSESAINLANAKADSLGVFVDFKTSSFAEFSANENYYDRVLASEFIEHISEEEGRNFINVAYKFLSPGGRLLIFTYPNTIQRKIGYPIIRFFRFLHGVKLPKKQLDTMGDHYKFYHLNEQNYFKLKKLLKNSRFKKFNIGYDIRPDEINGRFKKIALKILKNTFLKHIFLTNLYVIAEK